MLRSSRSEASLEASASGEALRGFACGKAPQGEENGIDLGHG
jgi:hypothetical protein